MILTFLVLFGLPSIAQAAPKPIKITVSFVKNPVTANNVVAYSKAILTNDDGSTQNITNSVSWSASNNDVIQFINNAGGMTLTGQTGTVSITASYDGLTDSQVLTVVSATKQTGLAIVGDTTTPLFVGQTRQFKVIATYSDGHSVDLTDHSDWFIDNGSSQGTPRNAYAAISNGQLMALATNNEAGDVTVKFGAHVIQSYQIDKADHTVSITIKAPPPVQDNSGYSVSRPANGKDNTHHYPAWLIILLVIVLAGLIFGGLLYIRHRRD